jgi:ATP synthase protein I
VAFFCRPFDQADWTPIGQVPHHDEEAAVLIDDRRVVPLTLLAQAGASASLAAVLWLYQGQAIGASALLGGAAAVVPNAFLAARLLAPRAGFSASAMLRAAWLGEIGKILLTVLAFAVIFGVIGPASPAAVFGGFIAAQVAVVVAPLFGGALGPGKAITKS